MAVNKTKAVTSSTLYSVGLSVNVTFAQNTAGLIHIEIACKQLLGESLQLG
jgi:hypothetical protein